MATPIPPEHRNLIIENWCRIFCGPEISIQDIIVSAQVAHDAIKASSRAPAQKQGKQKTRRGNKSHGAGNDKNRQRGQQGPRSKASSGSKGRCFNCGVKGHDARACTVQYGGRASKDNPRCWKCWRLGHNQQNCSNPPHSKNETWKSSYVFVLSKFNLVHLPFDMNLVHCSTHIFQLLSQNIPINMATSDSPGARILK